MLAAARGPRELTAPCYLHLMCRQAIFKSYATYFTAYTNQRTGRPVVTAAQLTEPVTHEDTPAVQAALATLSWPALCEFVARFASTTLGRQAVLRLPLSEDQEHSEGLVKETAAVDKLESEYAVELDFGGTSTSQVPLACNESALWLACNVQHTCCICTAVTPCKACLLSIDTATCMHLVTGLDALSLFLNPPPAKAVISIAQ